MLEGYELVFCRVATLKKKKGATVPLVLWELTPACEQALDRYEGYPHLYGKKYFTITWEGKVWRMMIYLMTAQHAAQEKPPTETYRQVIEQGYAEHGFDTTPLDEALRNAHQLLRG
jgi:hypothetical protein